ncbi:unnamed protein product [Sphagnum balticum]
MNPSAAAVSWNKFAATQELGLLQPTSTTTAAGEESNKNGNVNGVGGIAGGTTLSVLRVAVRPRPLQQDELTDYKTCKECVSYTSDGRAVLVGKRIFAFDRVYGPMVGQEDVYLDCVKPLVDSCCAGYNATVLAYGQTGSGKTFTMGCGKNVPLLPETELGILPRAIRQLYSSIEERSSEAEFLIKCAFVEIHNEEIKDLLHPATPSKSISVREDAHGDIILAGVKEEVVTSFENMIRCLEYGSMFRTTGSTMMNQHSSRSHAIFTIIVEQRSLVHNLNALSNDVITAKFHLVDLAGSERVKRTGAVGMSFKESVTINCGLLALGNVISALGDERKKGRHVPYRQSKLTRVLQDSLGGNSRTCMIACISTAEINLEETLNTLKYANRACNIRNKPIINHDLHAVMLNQALQRELLLTTRMCCMDLEHGTSEPYSLENSLQCTSSLLQCLVEYRGREILPLDDVNAPLKSACHECEKWEKQCLKLHEQIQESQFLVGKLQQEMHQLQNERDRYQVLLQPLAPLAALGMKPLLLLENVAKSFACCTLPRICFEQGLLHPKFPDHVGFLHKDATYKLDPSFPADNSLYPIISLPNSSIAGTDQEDVGWMQIVEFNDEKDHSWMSKQEDMMMTKDMAKPKMHVQISNIQLHRSVPMKWTMLITLSVVSLLLRRFSRVRQ